MKKIIQNVKQIIRPQPRTKGSIIAACQQVRMTALSIRDSLNTFKKPLTDSGDAGAVKVIDELESLAALACTRVMDRLIRLTGPRGFIDLVESPLKVKGKTDSSWAPTTWTGIHAELLTYFIQSIEICRGALSSVGITSDHVTHYMLVQVLALFEEMIWIAEMNPPEVSTPLSGSNKRETTEVQEVRNVEHKSCALMICSPTSILEVVAGTLELSPENGESAWFVPRTNDTELHVRLDMQIVRRLIDVPSERQPLFQGCTNIIELSTAELCDLDSRLREFIVRPLLDSGTPVEYSGQNEAPPD